MSYPILLRERRPAHVGFITISFADESGQLFEGGAERHLLNLAKIAQNLGADVTIYQRGSCRWQGTCNGIRVVAQPTPRALLGRILSRQATLDGCTHLHFQYLEQVPWWGIGKPVTATSHGVYWDVPFDSRYRQWYPGGPFARTILPAWRFHQRNRSLFAIGRCDRILGTDTTLLRLVQDHRPALRERIDVVLNYTDIAISKDESTSCSDPLVRPLMDARRQGHVVVFVPRNLSFVRGGAWLAAIVEQTTAATAGHSECHFFVTGAPVDVYGRGERYRALFAEQFNKISEGSQRRLHVVGGLPHSSMAEAYRASDIVLIPTYAFESTSLAALEAMGAGIPVVATNIGGLNDAIRHRVTGLLVQPNAEAIGLAIAELAGDAALRARMGAQGRKTVTDTFTLSQWQIGATDFARRAGWSRESLANGPDIA